MILFRPQTQRLKHDPANGSYGDCQRTCLAMVLGFDAEEVPHFADPTQFPDDEGCRKAERAWLAERGWAIIQLPIPGDWGHGFLDSVLDQQPDIPLIVSGKSPRGEWNHDVVIRSGVLHDPHPDATGLAGPCIDLDRPDEPRWFWVTVLTPLSVRP